MSEPAKFKICIDREQCIGDGICVNEAPETFDMDDDQLAFVRPEIGDDKECIMAAAEACPLDIIVVQDAESGKQLYPEA